MRARVHTSGFRGGGFSSRIAGGSAVAAAEKLWGAAGGFDGLVTRWRPGLARRRRGQDDRSDERGDQRSEKQHCA